MRCVDLGSLTNCFLARLSAAPAPAASFRRHHAMSRVSNCQTLEDTIKFGYNYIPLNALNKESDPASSDRCLMTAITNYWWENCVSYSRSSIHAPCICRTSNSDTQVIDRTFSP